MSTLLFLVILLLGVGPAQAGDAVQEITFVHEVMDAQPPRNPWFNIVGDLDGNGRPDVIIGGQNGPLVWYANPGWRKTVIADGGWNGVRGATGDIDGDGHLDIVMGGVVWFRNPGKAQGQWTLHRIDTQRMHDVLLADLDGNGRLDVVGRDQSAFGKAGNADADLDGKRGTITVRNNPDARARGFIVAHENKYAWQVGEDGQLRAFMPNVYMNYRRFGNQNACGWTAMTPTFSDPDVLQAYLDEAEAHGCNAIQALICNQWFHAGAASSRDHQSENPDPETFSALERAIVEAHTRGMHLHIWAWGDEQRGWTPIGVGGVNGVPDRRVQRYLAARLGPVPGWTMSYGFDLNEWVRPEQVLSWVN